MFPIILAAALATVPGRLSDAHFQTVATPVVQVAAYSQSSQAKALNSKSNDSDNDSDNDFDNDSLHPDGGKR